MDTEFKKANFISDAEKMRDFKELSKEEFLQSYSYLTEEEYDNTKEIYTKSFVKTRCNMCMAYFEYDENNVVDTCPFCNTGEYLTDFTQSDIDFLKKKGLY